MPSEPEILISDGGDTVVFRVTPTIVRDYWFGAAVDCVTGWELDGTPSQFEPYLSCDIKWDSCSHFRFGEPRLDAHGDRDGYLHLCGVDGFKQHVLLLRELYRIAFEQMGREPEPDERWEPHPLDVDDPARQEAT